jgi:acyl carrier protein
MPHWLLAEDDFGLDSVDNSVLLLAIEKNVAMKRGET